jgi:VWFA-related protein
MWPEGSVREQIGVSVLPVFVCIIVLTLPVLVNAQDAGNSLPAQASPSAQSSSPPLYRTTSRLVLLDVIVTDNHGEFVPSLKVGDFTVLEDNKPQKIIAFVVQAPAATPAKSYPPIELPPHQYTNFTFIKPEVDRPVTVVLMDTLNTTGSGQVDARKQMIQFLEKLPPGQPVALFVLTAKLAMIQGFSGDSGTLVAAARALLGHQSLLLSPETERQQGEILATTLENVGGPASTGSGQQSGSMPVAPIGQAIRNALAAQDSFQKLERMVMTINALDALARAVAGYPGRKNLIWLSAEFPVTFGPDLNTYNQASSLRNIGQHYETNRQVRDLGKESPPLHQTAALLAAARMAVYPIDVRGQISMGTGLDVSTSTAYLGTGDLQTEISRAHGRQITAMWDAHEAMGDIARETGGRAFYGTNDLKDAMSRSVQQGSSYYTLAYTPTNHEWRGKYRKIEVKTSMGGAQLTYRRGYYALPERALSADRAALAMTAAMQLSVPEFTGLLLRVQVLPPDPDHKVVQIDYAVGAQDINFSDSADQRKLASVDFAVTAWDKELKLAAHKVDTMEMTLRASAYQQVLQSGVPFHQELELKPGTYTLRLGVLDRGSNKIGSVQASITIPEKGNSNVLQKSQ